MSLEYRRLVLEMKQRVPRASDRDHIDIPGFHGTPRKIQGARLRATRTPGLPEPTGVSYATKPKTARQFGGQVYRTRLRGKVGNAETFMARARHHMKRGLDSGAASAKTQREFTRRGFHGVRWGEREVVMFRGKKVRAHR